MSTQKNINTHKITIRDLHAQYLKGEKITAITAYDYTFARMADQAGADLILVGDSLGMVVQGAENTLCVDIEHVIYHTTCTAKGVKRAHLMADMPFMSYQSGMETAIANAGKLIKAGAESIKMEGGEEIAELVWYLQKIGIPVMGHVGLKPQSVNMTGGYRVQGKSKAEADEIIADALTMEEAGAFALLLESVPVEVAKEITEKVSIPTIGIGSGPNVSGQILVIHDVLGADPDFKPRFVKKYFDLNKAVKKAIGEYCDDVRSNRFPAEEHSFHRNLVNVEIAGKK